MPAPGNLVHLRRISPKHGVPVTACTGMPILASTRTRFANRVANASCPKCRDYAARVEARQQRKATA